MLKNFARKLPGILLCLMIAGPAWVAAHRISALSIVGAPVLAMLSAMSITLFMDNKGALGEGIAFVSKKILQSAVVLLGFGLNLSTVGRVGASSLPIIVSTISVSLLIAYVLQKRLDIPVKTATLVGVGSSICGGSAIAAAAPVIEADDEEIAQAISVIFLFNVAAAVIFPTMGKMMGMTNDSFALFAGTAINDTSSVTAAASTWDTMFSTGGEVLEYATIVKLTRTLAIIPITLGLSIWRLRSHRTENHTFHLGNVLPVFIIYFVLASLITTLVSAWGTPDIVAMAADIFSSLKTLSKFFIVMAMTAIGLNTNVIKLVKKGGRPIFLGFVCWIAISAVSLTLQNMLGL